MMIAGAAVLASVLWLGLPGQHGATPRPEAGGIRSLAVLPLINSSGDASQEYLADGVTEQLISDLAEVGGLRVISRTSSMTYKATHKRLSEIARELHVDAVVEGSIVRSGDRVRINAGLIDARTDRQVWASTYDRDMKDVLAMQGEIARAVARSVQIELTPAAQRRMSEERVIDPRSFDAYVRGRYALNKGSREELLAAVQDFQKSLDADPTNAAAYAGMGEAYSQLGYLNYTAPRDAFPKAKAAVNRALELDPSSSDAHAVLGYIHLYYDWDFPGAEAEFRNAIELNPSLASAHRYYGIYLAAMLRPGEASRQAAIARSLDPFSVGVATDSGFVMYYDRDYREAARELKDAIALNPKAAGPHFWLGRVYQAEKKYDQAAAEYAVSGPGVTQWPPGLAGLGHMDGLTGRRTDALRVLNDLGTMSKRGYVSPYCNALVYLGLGDRENALRSLRSSLDERANWLVWLLKDPRWDPMRSDPRFQEIVQVVGFPADARARSPRGSS